MSTLPISADKAARIEAFLAKAKAMQPAAGRGRLIFALDTTASREATWDIACQLQSEMFEATASIGGLQVQLVYFRGLNECRATQWHERAGDLRKIMVGIRCESGMTQIARVLRHALEEARANKVAALVLVGDAMEENVDELGRQAGELGRLGTKVFVFHEGDDKTADRAFRQIAKACGGAYAPFDTGSAKQLRELLGAVAAYAAGVQEALLAYGKRAGGAAQLLIGALK